MHTKSRIQQIKEFKSRHAELIHRCKEIDFRMVHITDEGLKLINFAKEELGYAVSAKGSMIIQTLLR